jgi:small subunit ribosomal protein S20
MRNKNVRTRMTTSARNFEQTLASGDLDAAGNAADALESVYNRAVSKGVIPQSRASRKISRIKKRLHAAKTAE